MSEDLAHPSKFAAASGTNVGFGALLHYVPIHLLLVPAALAALAWLLQHGPLDLAIASAFADPATHTFTWQQSVWLEVLGHQAARGLPILVGGIALASGLAGFMFRPLQPWRALLLTLGASMIAGPALISALKPMTSQHCPADLQTFGGFVSEAADLAAPFWAAGRESAGRCLPSGHAGGGYALLALYFAGWAADRPAWRWAGLALGVAAGLLFSLVRIMQGAHFASATVWSAAIDWTICAVLFTPLICRAAANTSKPR